MNYETWRATFQSSEHAARAAYSELQDVRVQGGEVEPVVAYRYRVIDDPQGWEYSSTPLFGPESGPGPKEEYQALTLDQLISEMNDTHPPAPAQGVPEGWREAAKRAVELCDTEILEDYPEVAKAHIRGLAKLILSAPSHPGGEWVDLSQECPKLTGWYCVAIADPDDIGWSTSVSWTAFWNGECWEDCDPVEDGQPVTHWMPMPEPPKGGQADE